MVEQTQVTHGPGETHEPVRWRVWTSIAKFEGDWTGEQLDAGAAKPYEVVEDEGNLLLIGGASSLWQCLIGNGTATGGAALTYFNNTNAVIGVGTSNTAEADTQTGLTGAATKAMDATYPAAHGQHGHGWEQDDHVPVDVRERGRESGVGGVGPVERDALHQP